MPRKISTRIVALILFILLANAALTTIFSRQHAKELAQQKTTQVLKAVISYIATNSSVLHIDKVLETYGIQIVAHPTAHVLPAQNDILQKISLDFNKAHKSKISLYEDKAQPNILYILYTPSRDNSHQWLTIPQEPVEKHSITIAHAEEFIILLIIFLGSYFTARTINKPLEKIMKSLDDFGLNIIPSQLPEEGSEEIEHLARSVNQMIRNHHALAKERELMLAGISHDLRTPLTRLQLLAELSSASPDTVTAMKEEIEQITKMQQQFIDFITASTQETSDWVHLNEFCQELANKYRLSSQIIHLDTHGITDIVLKTQPIGLYRILTNGINNAIKYGEPPYSIELKENDKEVTINIKDMGVGVPDNMLLEIFKPLYRGDAARQNADGSGLGLAIISRIVERLGGTIRAYNLQPKGFCLEIKLPK